MSWAPLLLFPPCFALSRVLFCLKGTGRRQVNFFGIGTMELLMVLVVALIALGPKRLPRMAEKLGVMIHHARRQVAEARKTLVEVDDEMPLSGSVIEPPMVSRGADARGDGPDSGEAEGVGDQAGGGSAGGDGTSNLERDNSPYPEGSERSPA